MLTVEMRLFRLQENTHNKRIKFAALRLGPPLRRLYLCFNSTNTINSVPAPYIGRSMLTNMKEPAHRGCLING